MLQDDSRYLSFNTVIQRRASLPSLPHIRDARRSFFHDDQRKYPRAYNIGSVHRFRQEKNGVGCGSETHRLQRNDEFTRAVENRLLSSSALGRAARSLRTAGSATT